MNKEITKLSKTIVDYSINVKEKERVLIFYYADDSVGMVKELIKDIYEVGGIPSVCRIDKEVESFLLKQATDEELKALVNAYKYQIDNNDSIIYIRHTDNEYEGKLIPSDIMASYGKQKRVVDDVRVNDRKWVLFNYPCMLDAYKAKMSYDDFYKYAFEVMNVDYSNMLDKIKPLKELMERTDKVRMVGPNTDISFSIKGMPAIPCCGEKNIPDGEIYTAPVQGSIEGTITYNTPSPYYGNVYNNISLTFEQGKIVKCSCDEDNEALEEIFNTDEGARYVGEFSFGLNPKILEPMGDILYDEKIKGSIHFTPGMCYDDCNNGNKSAIHWDLVWIQRADHGGGEVYFDDVLIRKDGVFVLPELEELNNL